jgi:hypothetical protein
LADQKEYFNTGQIALIANAIFQLTANIFGNKLISVNHYGLSFYLSALLPLLVYVPTYMVPSSINRRSTDAVQKRKSFAFLG